MGAIMKKFLDSILGKTSTIRFRRAIILGAFLTFALPEWSCKTQFFDWAKGGIKIPYVSEEVKHEVKQ
jgi:hypothetical protein